MKYKIKDKPYGLVEFYDTVAKEMGYADTKKLHYDCRHINVAQNVEENFFKHYIALVKDKNPNANIHETRSQIAMLLAMNGPKVDKTLNANEVEVFSGFIY